MTEIKPSQKDFTPPATIFLAAFLLRIFYWIFLKNNYFFYEHPGGDVLYYQQWAKDIARGDWLGSETFWGLPLYPYFLAVLERWSLGNGFFIRLAHIFLGSLNCVLVYLIARRIFQKEAALLSGFLTAASFTLIHYDWLMVPVPLLIFCGLMIVLAFLNKDKIKTWQARGIVGLLVGITALGDGKILIFAVLALIYLFWKERPAAGRQGRASPAAGKKIVKVFLPLVMGVFIVLGLTGLRNKIVGGDWIWVSAQNGLSFYVGNNPRAAGVFENPDFIRPTHGGQDEDQVIAAEALAKRKLSPAQVVQFWRGRALCFITNDPMNYLRLLVRKFKLFFTDTEYAYDIDMLLQRDWKRYLDINPLPLVFPLALMGIFLARLREETVPMNIMILSQLLFTLIFFLTDRHRATILPFLIIYESRALVWLVGQARLKRIKPVLATVGALIVFAAIFRPQNMAQAQAAFYRVTKSGAVYERRKDFVKAREQYARALELRPGDTNAMYNLGNTCAAAGELALAQGYYEKILSLNPEHVDALFNLGFVLREEGADARSFAILQRLVHLQPNSPDVLFQAGQIASKLGDCASAKNYFEKLIRIKPDFTRGLRAMMDSCRP
ncbi:MAG: tetratricopeptide repeat protein [Candidatus Omnitrophica bacterium]|nr:tetratricopeptide repeat protein [Candidatus Omnitrophota bacterium]